MALGAVTGTIPVASKWSAGLIEETQGYYTVGAAVAVGDTITFTNIIPAGGVQIISTRIQIPKLDTNATPTATLLLGDATDDNRFIDAVSAGWDDETSYVTYDSNVTPSATVGVGYIYTAATSLVLKVGGTMATAASTGHIALWVRYRCVGNV